MSKYHQRFRPLTTDLTRLWTNRIGSHLVHTGYVRVQFPSFIITGINFNDASYIVSQFVVSLSNNFSIRRPYPPATGKTFCMIISWLDGGERIRRKLWSGVGEVVDVPDYNGEVINKDCRFECWNAQGQTTVTLNETLTIGLSITFARENKCYIGMLQEDTEYTFAQENTIPRSFPIDPYASTTLPLYI